MKYLFSILLILFFYTSGFCESVMLSIERRGAPADGVSSSYRVSEEDIEMQNTNMALGVLENIPGVFVNKTSAIGRADTTIRGLGDSGRAVGLFVDGRREKMSIYGCTVSQSMLNANVAGVEVYKGANSLMWGNGALGGAINIITKRPVERFEGYVQSSYGTYNTQNYSAFVGSNTEKFIFSVSANKLLTDGHVKNSAFNAGDYSLKTVYKIDGENEISFSGRYFSGIKYEPKPSVIISPLVNPPNDMGWNEFERGSLDLTYSGTGVNLKTFADFGRHKFSNGWDSQDNTLGAFLHLNAALYKKNMLTYGIETEREQGKIISARPTDVLGTYSRYNVAAFVLDEHSFTQKLKAAAGARYNYDEISGGFFAPQAKISYAIAGTAIARAVYSKAFRTPYLNELYTLAQSNQNLKPEEVVSYEAGLSATVFNRLNVDAAAFIMEGDNLIQVYGGRFENTGDYFFRGAELSLTLSLDGNGSKLFAGYTKLYSGDKIQGRPGSKADIAVHYNFHNFKTALSAVHIGEYYYYANPAYYSGGQKQKLSDYTVFNFKVNYALTKNLEIFAAVDNFTNEKYDIFTVSYGNAGVYQMPGVSSTLGVKYAF